MKQQSNSMKVSASTFQMLEIIRDNPGKTMSELCDIVIKKGVKRTTGCKRGEIVNENMVRCIIVRAKSGDFKEFGFNNSNIIISSVRPDKEIIDYIVNLHENYHIPFSKIAIKLNEMGKKSANGKPFTSQIIYNNYTRHKHLSENRCNNE